MKHYEHKHDGLCLHKGAYSIKGMGAEKND